MFLVKNNVVYNNNLKTSAVVWMWAVTRHGLMYMGRLKYTASKLTVRTQTNIYTHFHFTTIPVIDFWNTVEYALSFEKYKCKPVRHPLSFSRTFRNTIRTVNGRYSNICMHISQGPSTRRHAQTWTQGGCQRYF